MREGEKEIQGDKRRNKTKSDRGIRRGTSLQCPREFLSSVKKLIGRLSPLPPLLLTCISLAYQTFRENNISLAHARFTTYEEDDRHFIAGNFFLLLIIIVIQHM